MMSYTSSLTASLQFNLTTKKLVVTTKSNYKRWSKKQVNNQQESRVALKLGDQALTYFAYFVLPTLSSMFTQQ